MDVRRLWIVDAVRPPPLLAASSSVVVAAMAEEGAGARRTCADTFPYARARPAGGARLAPPAPTRCSVVRRPACADRPVHRCTWPVGRAGPPCNRRSHGIGLAGGDERCGAPRAAPAPRERALRPGRGRPDDGPGRSPSPCRRRGDSARRHLRGSGRSARSPSAVSLPHAAYGQIRARPHLAVAHLDLPPAADTARLPRYGSTTSDGQRPSAVRPWREMSTHRAFIERERKTCSH